MSIKINYNRLFWLLNISGWFLFVCVDFFLNYEMYNYFPRFWYFLSSYIYVCILCLFLRKTYNKYLSKNIKYKTIIFLIVIISVLTSTIWFLTDYLVYVITIAYKKPILEFLIIYLKTIAENFRMAKSLIYRCFPLIIWGLLYVVLKTWLDLAEEKEKREKAFLLAQQAQLQMLRYQLNPHFLFNSLSSIQALMYENRAVADKMITELSEFLRYTLSHINKTFVSLNEELDAIQRYLTIEKIRFEEKLEYSINYTNEALNYKVLSFLLQPIIENAIKHGIKTSDIPLKISVNALVVKDILQIEISNSGKWINNKTEGTGITNLKERLENAYHKHYVLKINEINNKVVVLLELEHLEDKVINK